MSSFHISCIYYMYILCMIICSSYFLFFFFNDTPTTEIYTLSHTTLFRSYGHPTPRGQSYPRQGFGEIPRSLMCFLQNPGEGDRKSTRLNSSHMSISYAVFCLKKKKKMNYKNHA